jgi:hypothetical protein
VSVPLRGGHPLELLSGTHLVSHEPSVSLAADTTRDLYAPSGADRGRGP